MDDGAGGAFTSVIGYSTPYTLNSYTITSGIVSGATYRVMYRAANAIGFGAFSGYSMILASTIPGAPGQPTSSISADQVVISWT